MQVDFYHLTRTPVERVLPRIAERVLEEGSRLLVVSENEALAERLDAHLWNYRPESFLPHGRTGMPGEKDQPVLISANCEASNLARNIALGDGVWRDDALKFDRAFLLFGEDHIQDAREAWRSLGKIEGLDLRYWKQDETGKWQRER